MNRDNPVSGENQPQQAPISPARASPIVFALSGLLLASLAFNGLLFWKAHTWRLRAEQAAAGVPGRSAEPPGLGTVLPTLKGRHLDGSQAVVDFAATRNPTLLYVLSPQCIWCLRNRANIQTLLSQSKGKYRVVLVSLNPQGFSEHVAENKLNMPDVELVAWVPEAFLRTHNLTSTPQTLVVSPDGRILKWWRGAFNGEKQQQVEEYFGVHLPGLAE
jgi:hypothetical protein